ncbi:glutamine synthetase family protein [Sphaerisporangium sp. NPDC051011]|uniref:glutamine synthetase family protein n=1 Tax=Sphaerisporangium sp. NPDC051011 TaxID=3155792 RepID=UPI0033EDFA53
MSEITTRAELLGFVEEHGIRTVRVGAVDIDGVWRGKRIPVQYFTDSVWEKGTQISNILFGWDMVDELLTGVEYTGWHTGYPDVTLKPDLSTLTLVPWEPHTASVICDIEELDGTPLALSPRRLLRKVLEDAADLGFSATAAYEFEFYLLRQSPGDLHRSGFRDLEPLTHGSRTYSLQRGTATEYVLGEIRERLQTAGVYIEACNSEHGPGQFEVNIHHDGALRAADHALLLKNAVKEIAAQHGHTATFIAKLDAAWAGSSGHVHQSLWCADGTPAFACANPCRLSETGAQYVAGLLTLAREMTAIYLPTVNSYKRTEGGSWAGASATWGRDNRTVAVRSIPAPGAAARVENRIPGADANPYLVIAANVASGLHGIRHRLTPPAEVTGNAYELPNAAELALPASLDAAVEAYAASPLTRELFGKEFVEHFATTRRWEISQFGKAVTDWELRRYLEVI